MTHIVDRRLNPRDKALKNRKRFMDLHKKQIKESVKKILDSGEVDMSKNNKKVRVNPTSEPTFRNNSKTGNKDYVLPGNKEFVPGDHINKPQSGDGSGRGNEGSPDGDGEDDFEFDLTDEEFRDYVFEEMELPDFVKKQLKNVTQYETQNAGYKSEGNPSQLDIIRSMKNSIGRRIGLRRPKTEELIELEELYATGMIGYPPNERRAVEERIEEIKRKRKAIPWIDPFDVRYKNQIRVPKPHTQAVMFCVMDVSFSMGEEEKDVAKRFYILLNLFLRRKYNNVDVVFIAHHAEAMEVDEETFFTSKISGGTVVSTALDLTMKIIRERYKPADWNIYIAQASDGDNYPQDEPATEQNISDLLSIVQYYAYIETLSDYRKQWVNNGHSVGVTSLWGSFKKHIEANQNLALQRVPDKKSVWKVFSNLFHRTKADNAEIFGD